MRAATLDSSSALSARICRAICSRSVTLRTSQRITRDAPFPALGDGVGELGVQYGTLPRLQPEGSRVRPHAGAQVYEKGAKAGPVLGGDIRRQCLAGEERWGDVQERGGRPIRLAHDATQVGDQVGAGGKIK